LKKKRIIIQFLLSGMPGHTNLVDGKMSGHMH